MSADQDTTKDDQTEGNTGNDAATESTDPGPVPGEGAESEK